MGLFGTTGVRGIFGLEFKLEDALRLGYALGEYLGSDSHVIVGRDTRMSAKIVEKTFISGLIATGCSVHSCGIVTTPTLTFLCKKLKFSAGVMITASHNPPEYIGIKFWNNDGSGFDEIQEKTIEKLYFSQSYKIKDWSKLGDEKITFNPDYTHLEEILDKLNTNIIFNRQFKVVIDPGCGAAFRIAPKLFKSLNCKILSLNAHPDGFFPGRSPKPDKETLVDLATTVKTANFDLGVGFDGDADRVIFVDDQGNVIEGDRIIALFSKYLIENENAEKIVTTIDSSMIVEETVNKCGGKLYRTPVGDIKISLKLKEIYGDFGGESCGVYIWPSVHYGPDSLIACGKILELMATTNKKLSDLMKEIPKYPIIRKSVKCPNKYKQLVMEKLEHSISQLNFIKEVERIDGLNLKMQDGWSVIRPSGTEPLIRITVETKKEKILNLYVDKILSLVKSAVNTVYK